MKDCQLRNDFVHNETILSITKRYRVVVDHFVVDIFAEKVEIFSHLQYNHNFLFLFYEGNNIFTKSPNLENFKHLHGCTNFRYLVDNFKNTGYPLTYKMQIFLHFFIDTPASVTFCF